MSHAGVTVGPTLDIAAFTDAFLRFEVAHDLFAVTVRGESLWEHLRYSVFNECIYAHHGYVVPTMPRAHHHLRELVEAGRFLLAEWLTPRRPYDLVVVNYDRTNLIEGRPRNVHTYPVIKELAESYRILLIDRRPTSLIDDDLYPCRVLRFRPFHLLDRARSFFLRFSSRERAAMVWIADRVRAAFDVDVDIRALSRSVFAFQLMARRRYLRLLRKYSPRVLVYADDANMKGATAAARTLGIPTVDLQHSLVSRLNILYHYPDDPRIHTRSVRSDYVFTYGAFWEGEYRLPVKTVPVGFPYLEEQIERTPPAPRARERNVIIVGMIFSRDVLVQMALDLARLLPDHTIHYKLRMEDYADWQQRYPPAFRTTANLKVIDSNETPLLEYFARCAHQVGINSTALYEGLAFGLTTFILQTGWWAEMQALVDREAVFLVSTAEEIAARIRAGARPPRPLTRDQLFRPNSRKNLRDAIEGVFSGGL